MRAAARSGAFDVLVVWRADRLFRSLPELLSTLRELEAWGVDFVSVKEPFDTTSPAGRLLFAMVGAFAEFERGVLRERTKAGLDATRRRGTKLGRPKRVVDVELVRLMRGRGMSIAAIARDLEVSEATLYRATSRSQ